MGIEFELKYQATPQLLRQLRQVLPQSKTHYRMQTTYYDTATEQFSSRHYTLRRRLENDVSVCTLKTPTGGLGRREWEVHCDTIQEALEELCKLGAPEEIRVFAAEGLIPVCGARFDRVAVLLELEGCTAELALDEGILFGADRQIPLCEVEVELKSGSEAVCAGLAAALAEKYGLQPEPRSKFRRALALYRGEEDGV